MLKYGRRYRGRQIEPRKLVANLWEVGNPQAL